MSNSAVCPHCHAQLPERYVGKNVQCPTCKTVFRAEPTEHVDELMEVVPEGYDVGSPPPLPDARFDDEIETLRQVHRRERTLRNLEGEPRRSRSETRRRLFQSGAIALVIGLVAIQAHFLGFPLISPSPWYFFDLTAGITCVAVGTILLVQSQRK